ncbi:hypothetical protein CK203_025969 [Vitis vinifera]|uniref:Uncharacterized protein n=1 Tax=Vitis vinifera TaxID=29760 RepID=A0A438IKN0_VITVI|nr:hypothetical protein CK203_025969 [Vitis vinifera]
MAEKKTVSSSRASEVRGKAIDKLDAKEFRERFCIPNNVAIELLNGRVLVPSEKAEEKTIIFSKEQFNAGLRFPLPALFKEFLHFTRFHPSSFIPTSSGMSAHLPSLQLVTELPDSTKGGATGHVVVRGAWAGLLEHPARPFSPNYSLVVPGRSGIEGPPCGLGGKGVFGCLSKLFEIDAKERQCKTLLTARNLTAVVREPQEYVINILPRKMPKEVVPGEHYTVKDFPIYEALKEADAKKRRLLLEDREKKKNEGTLRKAPGQKRDADSPPKKTPAKRRKLVKKNGKDVRSPLLPWNLLLRPLFTRRSGCALANLAEEAASVNHPDSRNPDADAAEAVCATPMEEVGVESQSQPSDDPDRLALVLQEIEVSCSSAHDAHPEGGEVEMVTETPAVPVVVPAEVAPGDVHPAGNVELRGVGREAKTDSTRLALVKPSAQMFEMVETLVSGLRGMANQYDLFTDLLRTTDYVKAFATRRKDAEDQLRLRLAEAEASLSTARGRMRPSGQIWLTQRAGRNQCMPVCLRHQMRWPVEGEVRQLRTEVSIEKKQREDLQLRLVAQKEELEREFAAEREEIEAEYQKQVDDTFIFGYRCCMKKNGIKRDVPSIPPGEEKKLHDKPAP